MRLLGNCRRHHHNCQKRCGDCPSLALIQPADTPFSLPKTIKTGMPLLWETPLVVALPHRRRTCQWLWRLTCTLQSSGRVSPLWTSRTRAHHRLTAKVRCGTALYGHCHLILFSNTTNNINSQRFSARRFSSPPPITIINIVIATNAELRYQMSTRVPPCSPSTHRCLRRDIYARLSGLWK